MRHPDQVAEQVGTLALGAKRIVSAVKAGGEIHTQCPLSQRGMPGIRVGTASIVGGHPGGRPGPGSAGLSGQVP